MTIEAKWEFNDDFSGKRYQYTSIEIEDEEFEGMTEEEKECFINEAVYQDFIERGFTLISYE